MLIVDRLEEDMAIIEYAQGTFALPICLLPSEIKAGDVIKLQVQIDKEATSVFGDKIYTIVYISLVSRYNGTNKFVIFITNIRDRRCRDDINPCLYR